MQAHAPNHRQPAPLNMVWKQQQGDRSGALRCGCQQPFRARGQSAGQVWPATQGRDRLIAGGEAKPDQPAARRPCPAKLNCTSLQQRAPTGGPPVRTLGRQQSTIRRTSPCHTWAGQRPDRVCSHVSLEAPSLKASCAEAASRQLIALHQGQQRGGQQAARRLLRGPNRLAPRAERVCVSNGPPDQGGRNTASCGSWWSP